MGFQHFLEITNKNVIIMQITKKNWYHQIYSILKKKRKIFLCYFVANYSSLKYMQKMLLISVLLNFTFEFQSITWRRYQISGTKLSGN